MYQSKHGWIAKGFTVVTLAALVLAAPSVSLANSYEVELVVQSGMKSKETDAVLGFADDTFSVTPDKSKYKEHSKTFAFDQIKTADYSYSKKPMLSGGGAVATAILIGVFAIPFFFMKKKNHWITVQTEDQFAVMKVKKSNYRAIMAEFETHGVTVNELKEEDKKDKDDDS